jgi:hypothetical protein
VPAVHRTACLVCVACVQISQSTRQAAGLHPMPWTPPLDSLQEPVRLPMPPRWSSDQLAKAAALPLHRLASTEALTPAQAPAQAPNGSGCNWNW